MEAQKLLDAALHCGAAKATILDQSQIVLSDTFRTVCESNQCGGFGKCWMCPPYIGEIHALMETVRRFSKGLWFQTIYEIEDSYDIEGMFEAGAKHAHMTQQLREQITPLMEKPFLVLSCGGCHLCERCAKVDDEPCRFPERALSSLEGYGIDVYGTTKDTDLKYINGANTVTYFGVVLYSE